MVSLAKRPEERMGADTPPLLSGPDYPYGLCLTLTDSELEKLDLSDEGVEIGDLLDMKIMIEVKGVHKDASGCRIEAQIIAGSVENESTEDEDDEGEED